MKTKHVFFVLALIFISFLRLNLISAQNYSVTHYGTKTGFPSDICKSIAQDQWGFVWIATDAGIIRFDGKNINEYKKALPSSFIKDLFVDKGQIYISHDLGLSKVISYPDSVFFETVIEGKQTMTDSTLLYPKRIFKDKKENLWIAEGQSIIRQNKKGEFKRFDFGASELTDSFEVSFSFTTDDKDNLYATSFRGTVFKWNEPKQQFDRLGKLPDVSNIFSILHVKNNLFLVATNKGVFQFNVNSNHKIYNFKHVLGDFMASSLLKNKKGEIFCSFFTHGVHALTLHGNTFQAELLPNTLNRSINNMIELSDGSIWCASSEGIIQIKKSVLKTEFGEYVPGFIQAVAPYKDGIIFSQSGVSTLLKDKKGNYVEQHIFYLDYEFGARILTSGDDIWVGSQLGYLYHFNTKTKKRSKFLDRAGFVKDMSFDKDGNIWICRTANGGLLKVSPDGKKITSYAKDFPAVPACVLMTKKGEIYILQNQHKDFLKKYNPKKDTFETLPINAFTGDIRLQFNGLIESENGDLIMASNLGLVRYDFKTTRILPLDGIPNETESLGILEKDGKIWMTTKYGILQRISDTELVIYGEESGLTSNTFPRAGLITDTKGDIWSISSKGFALMRDISEPLPAPQAHIINVSSNGIEKGSVFGNSDVKIAYNAYMKLKFISTNYPSKGIIYKSRWGTPEEIQQTEWTKPSDENEMVVPPLNPGEYVYQVKAKATGGKLWSETTTLNFEVKTPWFFTPLAITSYILILALIIFIGIRIYTWRHHIEKQELEKIIQKRTIQLETKNHELSEKQNEILAQNEELIQLNEQVVSQRDYIEEKNATLETQHKHITDSLRYAKKIQSAILPSAQDFKEKFVDHFVLFRPKDFVSGDYYWTKSTENAIYWVVADCTGHGVPGAFMSLIGTSLLNHTIVEQHIKEPKDILEKVHRGILRAVSQEEEANEEGMTMGLCMVEKRPDGDFNVKFAGAQLPLLYLTTDGKLERLRGHKKALGFYKNKKEEFEMEQYDFIVPKGCQLYMYSDGYQDQCNEEKKRIGSSRLHSMLVQLHKKPMSFQGKVLSEYLDEHQGKEIQRDDITVVGVKL